MQKLHNSTLSSLFILILLAGCQPQPEQPQRPNILFVLGNGDIFDNYPYVGAVQNYYNRYMSGEKVPAGWVNETDYDADLKE